LRDEFEYLAEDAKGVLHSLTSAIKGEPKAPQAQQPGISPGTKETTRSISGVPVPKQAGEQFGGYVILKAWPLARSNYYQVRQLRCPRGHINPADVSVSRCLECQSKLLVLLARESGLNGSPVNSQKHQALIQLSQSPSPGFLRHLSIFPEADRLYVISEYPAVNWLSLAQVNLPVWDHATLVQWCLSLGGALQALAARGFAPQAISPFLVLEPIVALGVSRASFADLTIFKQVTTESQRGVTGIEALVQEGMLNFMRQLVYILASGKPQSLDLAPRDFSDVPPPFRGILSHASHPGFASIDQLIEKLGSALVVPEVRRSLRQIAGYRTDVGRQRDHNEDFVGKYSLGLQQSPETPEIGLYLVADGMGGHQAGEIASQDVVRVILDEIQEKVQVLQSAPKVRRSTIRLGEVDSAGEVLRQAIQRANEVLHHARQQVGSDRGTTLTAALIVGQTCAVANVGDSRTYLMRADQLTQITQDHSLVASLLAANVIQPDEVRAHPQRSRIFRNLGERPDVEIDIYEVHLLAKDRLLLCSDGLWEMVLDAEIQQIMKTASDPQEACDHLVDAANLAGGQDNISVVCIWMT
jgi:serine/threonine protein phosphatase PrpC